MIGFKLKNRRRESRNRKRKQTARRKYIRYSLFAITCYIVFLVGTLPASIAVSFINNNPQLRSQIQLTSVSGTIWSGNVVSSQIAGINVGQLNWKLNILPLLLGKISVYIKFNNKDVLANKMSGSGTISASLSGNLNVDNFRLTANADSLAPLMYGLPARFGGDINILVDELSLVKGKQINLKSRMAVSKASLVSPQRIEYGDILIQSSPNLAGSQLILTDQGGPLILDGNIKIKGNGVYNVNLGLGARNSASDDLRNGLRFLGQRDATGKYRYKSNGKLPNW